MKSKKIKVGAALMMAAVIMMGILIEMPARAESASENNVDDAFGAAGGSEKVDTTLTGGAIEATGSRENPEVISPVVLDDAIHVEEMEPVFSLKNVTLEANRGYRVRRYLSFTVPVDSWVYMGGGFSLNNHDGASVHVDIYGSKTFTRKAGMYVWGYSEHDGQFCGFLKKGNYFIELKAKHANYSDYVGNIDLYAARIPVSKVFNIRMKTAKNRKSVRITLDNRLADFMSYVQYRNGKIGASRIRSKNAWIYKESGFYLNRDAATLLENRDDRYSFSVKKNGRYTILITDTEGSRYQKVISVKGIRKNKKKKK